ncbi:hypothetical protein BH11PLA2_BH11PLA2_07790 [soil metagenome]
MTSPNCFALLGALLFAAVAHAADLDRPPIQYATAPADDAVTALREKLRTGTTILKHAEEHGYLKSLLHEFNIPQSSQVLVFSRTSLQRSRIGPKTPRALYFNDDVTVGFCQRGDVLEVAAADPKLGTVFYTLDQNPAKQGAFTRQTESCLICHGSSSNQGFPGHLIRSVSPDRKGDPVLSQGTKRVDHSTPFEDRWGGWYVTGTSGKQTHMGNQIVGGWSWAEDGKQPEGSNVTDLKPYFTVGDYLTPHSDLVALLILEHQGEMHNRLIRANFLTRLALHEQTELNKAFGDPINSQRESITKRVHWACEPAVQYLFFSEETKLTEAVTGTSSFAKEFAARGPFDSKKRSLREFDLKTRMFRYPLSYTIYSKLFDGLPPEAKDRIYLRLWEVLSGQDRSKEFAHVSKDDRQAILEIVKETKTGLPAYWK